MKNLVAPSLVFVHSVLLALLAVLACSLPSYAAPPYQPQILQEKDWQVVCDNARTCLAGGYRAAGSASKPVAVLIWREAGPNSRTHVFVRTQFDKLYDNEIVLRAGNTKIASLAPKNYALKSGAIYNKMQLSKEQGDTLLPWLLKADQIEVEQAGTILKLSLAGAKGVLQQMDAWQGRLNTPGALVQRGTNAESIVLRPLPLPVVRLTQAMVASKPEDAPLAQVILPLVNKASRDPECQPQHDSTAKIHRLTADKLLLSLTCPKRVYSSMTHNWITQDKSPYRPVAIEAKGDFVIIQGGTFPARGFLRQGVAVRSTGDCLDEESWVFNGKNFALDSVWTTGMCRGFENGASNFFVYQTQLKD